MLNVQQIKDHRLGGLLGVTGALFMAILLVIMTTTPDRIGPTGVTVFFGLVYLFFAALVELGIQGLGRRWRFAAATRPHWWLTLLLAGLPTLLLALSSLRQLQGRDWLIVVVLAASLLFYWQRRAR